jgi:hypothetical protein
MAVGFGSVTRSVRESIVFAHVPGRICFVTTKPHPDLFHLRLSPARIKKVL